MSDEEYEIECILDSRKRHNRMEYCVKWVGWDDPTWEPKSGLPQELVAAFHAKKNSKAEPAKQDPPVKESPPPEPEPKPEPEAKADPEPEAKKKGKKTKAQAQAPEPKQSQAKPEPAQEEAQEKPKSRPPPADRKLIDVLSLKGRAKIGYKFLVNGKEEILPSGTARIKYAEMIVDFYEKKYAPAK